MYHKNPELDLFKKKDKINSPIINEVFGPDKESVTIGYRFDGKNRKDLMNEENITNLSEEIIKKCKENFKGFTDERNRRCLKQQVCRQSS